MSNKTQIMNFIYVYIKIIKYFNKIFILKNLSQRFYLSILNF